MTTELEVPEQALRVTEIPAFTALTVSLRATLPNLVERAMPLDEALRAEVARLGLPEAPTQWIYTGVSADPTNEFGLTIALPVPAPLDEPTEGFQFQTVPAFRCASYAFRGRWSDFSVLYDVLFAQLYRDGHRYNGHVREVYRVVDLERPEQCVTDIQLGLAE